MSKIAFDVDDTLGNHTEKFIDFHYRVYRRKMRLEAFTSYGLDRVLRVTQDEAYGRLSRFYESDEFENISPYPGSQEFIQKLIEGGEQLFIITGRPQALKEKTKNWVRKYFPQIPQKNILIAGELLPGPEQTKGPICKKRNIDLIVEDSLEQALSCSAHAGVALFNRPWNKNSPVSLLGSAITRIDTWDEAYILSQKY